MKKINIYRLGSGGICVGIFACLGWLWGCCLSEEVDVTKPGDTDNTPQKWLILGAVLGASVGYVGLKALDCYINPKLDWIKKNTERLRQEELRLTQEMDGAAKRIEDKEKKLGLPSST